MFRRIYNFSKRHRYKILVVFMVLLTWYYFSIPSKLFNKPCSTVLFDRDGNLMGAKIAADGQWRFPHNDSVPVKFEKAIVCFEDKRFYSHWGVDVLALGRAIWSNLSSGRRVSGGSTLTMQTVRLMRDNPSRNLWQKFIEVILATRIEWSYNKKQILGMYASNAPFGGNVVGLDAAAWKYFGRDAHQLSWAESAMLAVLPNSPSLIHLSKNREELKTKRNRLLDLLHKNGDIDSLTCELSKLEELPDKPLPLPHHAPHLLERLHREEVLSGKRHNALLNSTLRRDLQLQVNDILNRHYEHLRGNQIHNAAALVLDVETGDVLAYCGNISNTDEKNSPDVDVITAPRSSGSILKPFLYASALNDGEITPQMLLPDVPSQYGGYTPKNFDGEYRGSTPASDIVARSLNIPSVHLLHHYGIAPFHHKLQQVGMTTLRHAPSHYGLTLVLGGAETKLWDLAGMYAGMARNLRNYYPYNGKYDQHNFRAPNLFKEKSQGQLKGEQLGQLQNGTVLSAAAIWHTFEAMQEVIRPGEEHYWRSFASSNRIAWKTGTSFGFRDAWAVGVTPRYVVAVWAGNADGEGRPGLIGVQAAAPILFDIFYVLGNSRQWFEQPHDEMQKVRTCRHSGHLASDICPDVDTISMVTQATKTKICPYHKTAHLDKTGQYRVHSDCESPHNMLAATYFVLPPSQEWYYKKQHPSYETLPPYRDDCRATLPQSQSAMAIVYPLPNMKIYVPRELDESKGRAVFEVAHVNPTTPIYWHIDDEFIGTTEHFHRLSVNPPAGQHVLTLVDADGETVKRSFEIIENER